MKYLNDYKIILVAWLALGIGISGYLYIYPEVDRPNYELLNKTINKKNQIYFKHNKDYRPSKTSILITLVGAILIGGIGYIISNKKTE